MGEEPGGSSQGRNRVFETTQWSLVLAAGDAGNPKGEQALAELCRVYWYPVYGYIRRCGNDVDSAQDLTQGFFTHILEKGSLRVARPERGRFRSFLLTSAKNYLNNERDRELAQKRGGGQPLLSLDFDTAEKRYSLEPRHEETPEKIFERRWALELLDRTLDRLREEMSRSGDPRRFDHFRPFLVGEGDAYREVADALDMSVEAVKVAVHRMRKKFGDLLREEVGRTVDGPEQVDEEIRHLFEAIGS